MIRNKISGSEMPMLNEDIEICQRVFETICALKGITTEAEREDLANQIIHSYQQGVKDEGNLKRLLL